MADEELFKIDIDGEDEVNKKKPDYYVDHFLLDESEDEGLIDESAGNTVSSEVCWNCDKTGHSLRDCQDPINRGKVNEKRKKFNKAQNASKRYHDNKFANLKPGYHSSKLRDALGLRRNEVPRHVYMMRVLGYPPGWLIDAKITGSGIKMYNSRGKRIPELDEEEGEIVNKVMKYDVEKIIEFPGFNVPLDDGVRDDCRSYGLPYMNPEHNIEHFTKHLEEISNKDAELSDSTDDDSADMDISEMLPVEIIEEVQTKTTVEREPSDVSTNENSSDSLTRSNISNQAPEDGEIVDRRKRSLSFNEDHKEKKRKSDETQIPFKEIDTDGEKITGKEQIDKDNTNINTQESTSILEKQEILEKSSSNETIPNGMSQSDDETKVSDKKVENSSSVSECYQNVNESIEKSDILDDKMSVESCSEGVISQYETQGSVPQESVSCTLQNDDKPIENCDDVHLERDEGNSRDTMLSKESLEGNSTIVTHADTTSDSGDASTSNSMTPRRRVNRSEPIPINGAADESTSSPRGSVTTSSFGTPNVKSHSPYSRLPSFDSFSKDISDVIDFENLPDSVGKYNSMGSLISRIRNYMSSKSSKSNNQHSKSQ